MMKTTERQSLNTKDLINIGIYTALYFVMYFVAGIMGFIPVLMLVVPFATALVAGIPFMLYLTKVKKPGMLVISSLILSILMVVTGHYWWAIVTALVTSFIAEWILRKGNYQSIRHSIGAYVVFALWGVGAIAPLFFDRENYFSTIRESYGEQYADRLLAITPSWVFYIMIVMVIVGAFLGALLGVKILKKHFKKAGIL